MNTDVARYLQGLPPVREARVRFLNDLILELYPDAVVDMSYKMPTYRVGSGWVAVANQRQYVSLYTCGPHHIGDFKAKYPQIKTGKGCINFRDKDELPVAGLRRVIRHAIEHPKGSPVPGNGSVSQRERRT